MSKQTMIELQLREILKRHQEYWVGVTKGQINPYGMYADIEQASFLKGLMELFNQSEPLQEVEE